MTDVISARPEPTPFLETWAQCLSQVLGQVAGTNQPYVVLGEPPSELAPAAQGDLWLIVALSGGLRGEMSLRLAPAVAARLARILMGEDSASGPVDVTADHREATLELMRQVTGLVSTSLAARWGEVQLGIEAGTPSWPASATGWLVAVEDSAPLACLEVHLSAALVAALRAEKRAGVPAPPASTLPIPPDSKPQLGLLMDMELAVVLRFGSRRLLLRDVLDLGPGAVIELDRQVHEPVDLLLDGRLLARGEVVVMDGNYALEVTEVAPSGREMESR
jgi:flagellar motor switch protein FliN